VPAGLLQLFQAVLQKSHKTEEGVTTLPGSLGVNPYEWTTAHKDIPPDWLHQEGHPCSVSGRIGTMQLVDGKLVCVVNSKESTDMNSLAEKKNKDKKYKDDDEEAARKARKKYNYGFDPGDRDSPTGKARRKWGYEGVDTEMNTDVMSEAVTLRFSSPSRVQLAKAATYFGIGRATGGLGNIVVHPVQGVMGNWYFEITSNEDNQFMDPTRMHGVIPAEVTVTKTTGAPKTGQTASQDEVRKAILEMVEERMKAGT
jgi:hypothetical protein